jgi:hypothetical protein
VPRDYTVEQERAIKGAAASLPLDSPLLSAMEDYSVLRAEARDCRKK